MEFSGLSAQEAAAKVKAGLNNAVTSKSTKTLGKIFISNTLTLFNILNFTLAGLVIWVGKYNQAAFLMLIIINIFIGLIQEIRAKRTIDKLSLISQPKAKVIRDGAEQEIAVEGLVLDDIAVLYSGNQVCSDCEILEGACEVNESFLTGESEAVAKSEADTLLAGSFIVSGKVTAKVVRIGDGNYAAKLSGDAKKIKATRAEIPFTLKAIIRLMSFVVVPLGLGIFIKSYFISRVGLTDSVLKMTASTISMIPQGLVALSSIVFAASIVRLGKRRTLCQDLYCVETLARVDVLCLDKTGTITEGKMQVDNIVYLDKGADVPKILAELMRAVDDRNATAEAIRDFVSGVNADWTADGVMAFSSARKMSGAQFKEHGAYFLGAPECVMDKDGLKKHTSELELSASRGERVLCLAKGQKLEENAKTPLAFLLLSDKIRAEAAMTFNYFYEQGVDIRIISGDNPITVSAIAKKVGISGAEKYVDASDLPDENAIRQASKNYKIFGRVTPEQKLMLIRALQADGHTVAMTGDGVNDVLALKEADCSISLAAGTDAARAVSHMVLLDNNFAALPKIVAEGRRTVNNLQRTASLYLVKTLYSIMLAVFFLFVGQYPFEPMHMTLVGSLTIGIPSVALALERNSETVKGRFITNVLKDSFPGALAIVFSIIVLQIAEQIMPLNNAEELANVSVALIAGAGFGVLLKVCIPLSKPLHGWLFSAMVVLFVIGWTVFYKFVNLLPPSSFTLNMLLLIIPILSLSLGLMVALRVALGRKKQDFVLINKLLRLDRR